MTKTGITKQSSCCCCWAGRSEQKRCERPPSHLLPATTVPTSGASCGGFLNVTLTQTFVFVGKMARMFVHSPASGATSSAVSPALSSCERISSSALADDPAAESRELSKRDERRSWRRAMISSALAAAGGDMDGADGFRASERDDDLCSIQAFRFHTRKNNSPPF